MPVDERGQPTSSIPYPVTGSVEDHAEALRRDGELMLGELGVVTSLTRFGDVAVMGSFVSDLMTHPEIDIGVHVGERFTMSDATHVIRALTETVPCSRVVIDDERGSATPGEKRDERFHVVMSCPHGGREWTLDISLFLHDNHINVADWHHHLRHSLSPGQRRSILTIKSALRGEPDYPGGLAIYTAVTEHDVRTLDDFERRRERRS